MRKEKRKLHFLEVLKAIRNFSHFEKGFTLIELLLVIAIVAIIGMSSVAFYSRFFTQNAVANTVDQLTNELRKAQSYAMAGKQNGNWGVHNGTNEIVLFQGATYLGRNPAFDEKFSVNSNITVSGFTDIIFTRTTGAPSGTATVTVSGAGNSKDIAINTQGIVGGTVVSGGGGGGPWFNTSYLYKKKITIDHTKVSGGADLSNFPVLISLTDVDFETIPNGGSVSNSSGYDIIFTDSTETTKLDHEIEKYDPVTGTMQMWVRIPTLATSTNTEIYIYFGNGGIASSQENKIGTWDTNYQGVWHLSENPAATAPQILDSTSNSNDGTSTGSMTLSDQVAGKIDGSLDFDGTNDYLSSPNTTSLRNITNGTFAAWIKSNNNSGYHFIMEKGANDVDSYSFILLNGVLRFEFTDSGGNYRGSTCEDTPVLTAGIWHYVVVTYNDVANICTFYVNGSVSSSDATSYSLNTTLTGTFHIGAEYLTGGVAYWNGIIDETRVSNIVRSADWITTEYNNQNSPATFYSIGTKTAQ